MYGKKSIVGCFLKWGYPQNTPKWSFLVGKPMVVGYHHFWKRPVVHSCFLPPQKKSMPSSFAWDREIPLLISRPFRVPTAIVLLPKNVRSFNMSLRLKGPRPLHSLKPLWNKNRVHQQQHTKLNWHLVGGRNQPIWKHMLVKLENFPNIAEDQKIFETTTLDVQAHLKTLSTPHQLQIEYKLSITEPLKQNVFSGFSPKKNNTYEQYLFNRNLKHPSCSIGWLVPAVGCSRCDDALCHLWLYDWDGATTQTISYNQKTHSRAVCKTKSF